jgi:hypothetical protein
MLPIIAFGALYLRHRALPGEIAPGRIATAGLWFASMVIIGVVGYSLLLSLKAL